MVTLSCNHSLLNNSTPNYSNKIVVNENNQAVLLGFCSTQMLLEKPFSDWFIPNYNSYQTDSNSIEALTKAFKHKRI